MMNLGFLSSSLFEPISSQFLFLVQQENVRF